MFPRIGRSAGLGPSESPLGVGSVTESEIKELLRSELPEPRYFHTLGVQKVAVGLARIYGADPEKASLAALIHDCAKNMDGCRLLKQAVEFDILVDIVEKSVPDLLHGPVGAALAQRKFGVEDEEVLRAVRFHTTGVQGMTALDKIIYLADYIEPGRDFKGVDRLCALAAVDLDEALLGAMEGTIRYVMEIRGMIHCRTIEARNWLLAEMAARSVERGKRKHAGDWQPVGRPFGRSDRDGTALPVFAKAEKEKTD